ncbi:hypothetical protein SKAU_G00271430 [Synaphobranchus kaupii]|uniref:Uncharacterized protein n=1 Tax=Synaphobranchus kaupii TaxID=118154 RepID=A0A9Q1IQM0_SYNKA|nr:hypothetical protein SKAU_G00271430 [Synaphobranchus kaupii]
MQELATLVRPASPTDNTMVKLAGNTLSWLHTCMQILEEHYLENLGHLTKKLENIHLSNWLEAFQVATRSTTSAVSTSNRFSVLTLHHPHPQQGEPRSHHPQDQYQREWPERQTYSPEARHQHGTLRGRFCLRKHYTTRETGQAVGSQYTTGTGNQYHCRNDP